MRAIEIIRCPECGRKVFKKGLCDRCKKALYPRSKNN